MERKGMKKAVKKHAAKKSVSEVKAEKATGLKKQYLKTRPTCKVTFRLPGEAFPEAGSVTVVGDFNNWNRESTPMKRLKNGDFTVTIELKTGHDYCFRYLIDNERWENDWYADRYEPGPYGCDNSVVAV